MVAAGNYRQLTEVLVDCTARRPYGMLRFGWRILLRQRRCNRSNTASATVTKVGSWPSHRVIGQEPAAYPGASGLTGVYAVMKKPRTGTSMLMLLEKVVACCGAEVSNMIQTPSSWPEFGS